MMRRYIGIVVFCFLTTAILAQPSWTKKATKAVFTLKTFTADGTMKASSTGFFIGQQGEAVAPCQPFRGADRAVVIDADGREWPVECILGASETYDVAKFRVAVKKVSGLTVAAALQPGASVWLLPYREVKKVPQGTVRKVEKFNTVYDYYTVALTMPDHTEGSPLFNENGEVVGVMQTPSRVADTLSYVVSARFADSLRVTGLSINDPVLRSIGIKKALPSDLSQAQLSLYLGANSLDSAAYAQLVDDFIAQYPDVSDGYQSRATLQLSANNFAAAQQDMEQAIKKSAQKDEAHYGYSRLIYQKILLKPDIPYEPWTLDLALSESEAAYQLNPQPVYRYQQALVLFAQKNYRQALDCYLSLTNTSMRSADLFYEASRCQALLGDTAAQLALVDSAVAQFSRPYLKEAAPYLLLRAQTRMSASRYREAVSDLNEYESLMRAQLTSEFYYLRHQAELGGRLFQQALNDIDRAIEMAPDHDFYLAEKAALQIRVGLNVEAMETARRLISMAPAQSDGYLFLGLAQCLANEKAEGLKNLEKARDMGDAQAAGLIEKYAK